MAQNYQIDQKFINLLLKGTHESVSDALEYLTPSRLNDFWNRDLSTSKQVLGPILGPLLAKKLDELYKKSSYDFLNDWGGADYLSDWMIACPYSNSIGEIWTSQMKRLEKSKIEHLFFSGIAYRVPCLFDFIFTATKGMVEKDLGCSVLQGMLGREIILDNQIEVLKIFEKHNFLCRYQEMDKLITLSIINGRKEIIDILLETDIFHQPFIDETNRDEFFMNFLKLANFLQNSDINFIYKTLLKISTCESCQDFSKIFSHGLIDYIKNNEVTFSGWGRLKFIGVDEKKIPHEINVLRDGLLPILKHSNINIKDLFKKVVSVTQWQQPMTLLLIAKYFSDDDMQWFCKQGENGAFPQWEKMVTIPWIEHHILQREIEKVDEVKDTQRNSKIGRKI